MKFNTWSAQRNEQPTGTIMTMRQITVQIEHDDSLWKFSGLLVGARDLALWQTSRVVLI